MSRFDNVFEYDSNLNGAGLKVGVVMCRFNLPVCEGLLSSCVNELKRLGVADEDMAIANVPGALEIPLVLQSMAQSGKFDALVALGAVIRGSTTHYDYVCNEVSKGIAAVSLESGIPVLFGVLTTENIEQAISRAGSKGGNKGYDCALSAIEMVNLLRQM